MSHTITAKLYDLASNELADISGIALEKSLERTLNLARVFTIQVPAGDALLTAVTADDGLPNLWEGARKLIVWEDMGLNNQPIFHGRVAAVERTGDGTKNLVTITAMMPLAELGYGDRAGRVVRGSASAPTAGNPFGIYNGNFVNPKFASSVADQAEISGPDLIYQILTNTQNTGAESDPTPGEGPLPILIDADNFDLDVPPAVDLSPADSMDWPVLCGDFIQQLCSTGVCDVDERPVEWSEGSYVMSELTARSRIGTDRSGTVHFDYWTGDHNVSACRHVGDFFETICNKLYDYLGPTVGGDGSHWKANITPGSPGTLVDPTASRALYGGPGDIPGQFMTIRVFDSVGSEATSRPLYLALWNAEMSFRVFPRQLLYITPAPDTKALFEPPVAFDVGDMIAANVGEALGIELAEAQRVYGYTRTWNREGVARVSQLVTSAVGA